MSQNQSNGASGTSATESTECENGCGFDSSNRLHHESYWADKVDPREKADWLMRYTSHYYRVIDRQIAENHHTECLGGQPAPRDTYYRSRGGGSSKGSK